MCVCVGDTIMEKKQFGMLNETMVKTTKWDQFNQMSQGFGSDWNMDNITSSKKKLIQTIGCKTIEIHCTCCVLVGWQLNITRSKK